MRRGTIGALLLCALLTFPLSGASQEENGLNGEDPGEAAPEVRRGFTWEPGFTYRPGFPAQRRMQEEFGVSPEFEEEIAPEDEAVEPPPEEAVPEEEFGVSPQVDDEPLPPADRGIDLQDENEIWEPHPDSRIEPDDPLEPERTIQR